MIKHIDISAVKRGEEVDEKLAKYIQKKIGKLDRKFKKADRLNTRADVKLQETTGKGGKKCICEVILHSPGVKLTAKESTPNMYASVDVVESKLQNQIKKHNEKANIGMDKHQKTKTRRALGKIFSRRQNDSEIS